MWLCFRLYLSVCLSPSACVSVSVFISVESGGGETEQHVLLLLLLFFCVSVSLCTSMSVFHCVSVFLFIMKQEIEERGSRMTDGGTLLYCFCCCLSGCVSASVCMSVSEWKRWGRKRRRNDDDDDMMMMMMMMFALKGTNQDFLQPPCCSVNCLRQVRSKGQGAIVCKSRATHWVLIGYEGAAQLLCLTELKSYLFLAFFIG